MNSLLINAFAEELHAVEKIAKVAIDQQYLDALQQKADRAARSWESTGIDKEASLLAALGGALLGGAAGEQASRRLLKGKYMTPITLATSLGGSVVAGEAAQKLRRKKERERIEKEMQQRGYRYAR